MSPQLQKKYRVLHRCGYQCNYCARTISLKTMELDHVLPKSAGGGNEEENIVAACQKCNGLKSNRTPEQWREAISQALTEAFERAERIVASHARFVDAKTAIELREAAFMGLGALMEVRPKFHGDKARA